MVNTYVGRFAPSPTGPLHLGSLVAAMASYVDALAHGGRWLIRIEDVDEPRCTIDAERVILGQLDAYGFRTQAPIMRQSERTAHYERALIELIASGDAYACRCTRKMLESAPRNREGELIYPGACRGLGVSLDEPSVSVRLRVKPSDIIRFTDRAHGCIEHDLSASLGDFVIRRADGLHAYQLAVVVDDAAQDVSHVVRGADLLLNTPRQIYLQQKLRTPTPAYLHVPTVTNERGEKLSKQTLAPAIPNAQNDVVPTLVEAWRCLHQSPLHDVKTVAEFWAKAASQWHVESVSR
jgi:glutamyl-Q tRNA(Asp) synthetase